MRRSEAGFTLIELVMTISILGILATMALPRFVDLSGAANASVEQATIGAIQTGIELQKLKEVLG